MKLASRFSDEVIVSFSGGKDSVVTLDLCHRYFKTVHAFFMYQVPGLSFQEAALRYAEKRYGIEIMRIPHFGLSDMMRYGAFRQEDPLVGLVKIIDIYTWVRLQFDCWWISAGERISDSIVRRAMMKRSGSIDDKRGRFYPVSLFNKNDVMRYIDHHKLKISPEFHVLGSSAGCLAPKEMFLIKKHYPEDFKKIANFFPFIEASVGKYEMTL